MTDEAQTPAAPATAPTLQVHDDAPSAAIIKAAKKTAVVTDSDGRKITIRRLNALAKLDLSAIVGAERSQNEGVIGPCALAFSVTELDGEVIQTPNSYAELRYLIGKLDDQGLDAVGLGHMVEFGVTAAPEPGSPAAAALAAATAANLKNS